MEKDLMTPYDGRCFHRIEDDRVSMTFNDFRDDATGRRFIAHNQAERAFAKNPSPENAQKVVRSNGVLPAADQADHPEAQSLTPNDQKQ